MWMCVFVCLWFFLGHFPNYFHMFVIASVNTSQVGHQKVVQTKRVSSVSQHHYSYSNMCLLRLAGTY